MNILETPIFIPTYKRADSMTTVDTMRKLGFTNFTLCVRLSDQVNYLKKYGDCRYLVIPDYCEGNGAARQVILSWMLPEKVSVMMDDDIRGFSYKPDPYCFGGLRKATKRQVLSGFTMMYHHCETRGGVGAIIDRYVVARPSKTSYKNYGLMRQCLFIYRDNLSFHEQPYRFDRMRLFVDIDYSLQCAKLGIPMLISRRLCLVTRGSSLTAKSGGCGALREQLIKKAKGRDPQHAYWKQLMKLHPEVIEEKLNGKHRISWEGAYKIGRAK